MAADGTATTIRSEAEVKDAVQALQDQELVRLRSIARALARFSPIAADDLLQEAFCRALDRSRRWPIDVDAVPFLAGIMRSISSDAAKAAHRRPEQSLEVMAESGRDWPAEVPTAEQVLINAEEDEARIVRAGAAKRTVVDLFGDDLAAQIIVEGMMEGLDGEDLRVLTGLDKTAFASKRRLVRRRIAKAIPESMKP
jgi:DNA-directed RNA polymerase specialized sigma24 family protein